GVESFRSSLCILDDLSDGIRNPRRFESRIHAYHGDITGSEPFAAVIIYNFEIVSNRFLSFDLRIQPHSNRRAVPDRSRELGECFHSRHPDVVFLDERLPLLARNAEQLFFGLLNEPKEMRVINDTGRVDIAPIRLQPDVEHSTDDSIRRLRPVLSE